MIREINLVISGRVQGVGFRYYIDSLAKGLNLKGWVANRTDGSVEILAQGEETNLKKLYHRIKFGPVPALAQIEKIAINWQTPRSQFFSFSILDD